MCTEEEARAMKCLDRVLRAPANGKGWMKKESVKIRNDRATKQ